MSKTKEQEQSTKIVKVVLTAVVLLILTVIAFLVTDIERDTKSDSEKYLDKATEESKSASKRKKTQEIDVERYLELYENSEKSVVLITRSGCEYCKIAVPIIENILYEEKFDIYSIDIGKLTNEGRQEIADSNSYFEEGFATPVLLLIGENEIKDKIEGLATKYEYKKFFKKYGYIK